MANSHAKKGDIAAKAGASSGGHAATVEATAPAEGAGAADVAAPETPAQPENTTKSAAKVVEEAAKAIETVVKEAEKSEKPQNLKKIKVLRSHPQFAYHPGETGELPAEKADFLVEGGFAELVADEEPTDETEE